MYGSIYAGPALQESDAPVVRYQDLHRRHAPASAGAPEFGMIALDGQAQFGDVAFDGQAQMPSSGFGDVAFDGQVQMPSSGFGYTRADAGYGGARAVRDPETKEYVYLVNLQANPPTVEIAEAPAGKYTGPVTQASNAKAYASIVALARRAEQEEEAQEAALRGEEQPRGGGRRQQKDEDEESGWEKFTDAFTRGVSSAGRGVSRGLSGKPKRGGFQASGQDIQPVRGGGDKRAEESNVGKYALYAVGGLAGAALLAYGIKAAMGGGESE